MKRYRTLDQANFKGKRVLVRVDHNIDTDPDGVLKNDEKIRATLPTLEYLLQRGARLVLMTHVGRPKGKVVLQYSTVNVASRLRKLLPGVSVTHIPHTVGKEAESAAAVLQDGEILYLENVRFHPEEEGEQKDQEAFGKALARLGEFYVNEAFPSCHEYEEASTCAVARLLPAFVGLHLEKEVTILGRVLCHASRPILLIVSGAKMETKIPVIDLFLTKGDDILLGGCIANTFIAACGFAIGHSKYEKGVLGEAQEMLRESQKKGRAVIHVPQDVVLATEPNDVAETFTVLVECITGNMSIFDIGKVTIERYKEIIQKAKTIIWNGPLGFYEVSRFSYASICIAEAIREATKNGAYSVVGGGDTLDMHKRYHLSLSGYSFVSTGGGAMLEFLSGKQFHALEALSL